MIDFKLTISIIPFTSEIIGVKSGMVYFKEYIHDLSRNEDLQYNAVICMDKKLYLDLCNKWLLTKEDLCETWGNFCGEYGDFYASSYKKIGDMQVIVDFEGEDPVYKTVPIFKVIEFEEHCDMEV